MLVTIAHILSIQAAAKNGTSHLAPSAAPYAATQTKVSASITPTIALNQLCTPSSFEQGMTSLKAFFEQGEGIPEAIAFASSTLLDPTRVESHHPVSVFQALFAYGEGHEAAVNAVKMAIKSRPLPATSGDDIVTNRVTTVISHANQVLDSLRPYVVNVQEIDLLAKQGKAALVAAWVGLMDTLTS